MPQERAERQGAITSLAFLHLGGRAAIEFLNARNQQLAARPLDLAIDSAEGFARVERLLLRVALQ
jgi:hypothetical protein